MLLQAQTDRYQASGIEAQPHKVRIGQAHRSQVIKHRLTPAGRPEVGTKTPAHFWAASGVAPCIADIAVRMRSILPVSAWVNR